MATIRVTRELLEWALDLPANVELTGDAITAVDGVECLTFEVKVAGGVANGPSGLAADGTYALQYEETEHGLQLVSAIPVT